MLQTSRYPRFLPVGDTALTVELGDAVDPELNEAVVGLDIALAASELPGIIETVPSYRSLLIRYEPLEISFAELTAGIRDLLADRIPARLSGTSDWIVPVVYDPPHGPDLAEVAQRSGLTEQDVIARQTDAVYQVYTLGFAPGMPYLGGLPAELHLSRRDKPRPAVPPGAVMIGGMQAAIVPIETPSAWYLVGRTPLLPYMPEREDPFPFRAGDRVRFRRIGAAEFERLAALTDEALLALVRSPR